MILITAAVLQVNQGPSRSATSTAGSVLPNGPAAAIGEGTDSDRTGDNTTVAVGTGPQANYPCSGNAGSTGSDLLAIASTPPSGVQPYRKWWRNTEQVENLTFGDRSWQATVRSGTANLWDLLVVHSCLPVQTGRSYSLTFTASAGTPVTLRARVQDKSPPDYIASLSQDVLLGPEPQRWTLPFEGILTSAASELSFQIGGNPDAEIQVTDIALVDTGP
jgi:hypothetical protein